MSTQTRNILLNDASDIAHEDSHILLYKAGINQFDRPFYNLAILKFATWTKKPELYWGNYITGMGAYLGVDQLVDSIRHVNDEVKLAHENMKNIEDVVRLVKNGKIRWQIAMDVTGYYINEQNGEYLGPNKHKGKVED